MLVRTRAALGAALIVSAAAAAAQAPAPAGELVPQFSHTQEVMSLAWSRGGSFFVSGARGDEIKLWTADGRLIRSLRSGSFIPNVAISPDDKWLVVAGVDKTLSLLETSGKRWRQVPGVGGAHAHGPVAWSPTGEYFVACTTDWGKGACELYDTAAKSLTRFQLPKDAVVAGLWISEDGETIVTGGNRSVLRWSRAGALVSRFDLPEPIATLAVSPDGKRIATAWGQTTTVVVPYGKDPPSVTRVYDAAGKLLVQFPSQLTSALEFTPDGRWLVSGADVGNRILVHDAATGREVAGWKVGVGGGEAPAHLAVSPDGKRVVFSNHAVNGPLRFLDLATGRIGPVLGVGASLTGVALSPSSQIIATASADRMLRLWSMDGRLLRSFDSGEEYPDLLAVDPLGRFVASGSKELRIHRADGKELGKARFRAAGRAIAFAPDGAELWSADGDGRVVVHPLAPGRKAREFSPFGHGAIGAIAFDPAGSLVALAGRDEIMIAGRDGAARARIPLSLCSFCWTSGLAFAPDGRALVALNGADRDNLVVYDLDGKLLRQATTRNRSLPAALAVSPDGRFVAVTSGNDVGLYDLETLAPAGVLKGHRERPSSLAFTADGRHLVSGSPDATVRIWNLENKASMAFFSRGDAWSIFTDDGLYDASARGAGLLAFVSGLEGFGVEQQAARFNRPDLIYRRVGIGDEAMWKHFEEQHHERLRRLGAGAAPDASVSAPRLTITGHRDRGGELELELAVSDAATGLASLQVWVNGVPALSGAGRPLEGSDARVTVAVRLSAGPNRVEVSARNAAGAESLRAPLLVEGPAPRPATLWFVGLGVSRHVDSRLDLRFADRDVIATAAALRKARGRFADVRTLELVNERVSRSVLGEIRTFLAGARADDTVVLLAAGHGARDPGEAAAFRFVTHDADVTDLPRTAIAGAELEGVLEATAARRRLLLVDACQSGEVDPDTLAAAREKAAATGLLVRVTPALSTAGRPPRAWLVNRDRLVYRRLERGSGTVVFSSSFADEVSLESPALGNGLFTAAILRALTTREADRNGDGWLSAEELEQAVKTLVVKASGGLQHPSVDRDNELSDVRLPVIR